MKQQAIGIRLPKDVLKQIESLSREEMEDRSSVIRKLVIIGYSNLRKEKAAAKYRAGELSFSEAAHQAGLTLWEMERYLAERGMQSAYSTEDLARELRLLGGTHQHGIK